jgi:hypothetical protein
MSWVAPLFPGRTLANAAAGISRFIEKGTDAASKPRCDLRLVVELIYALNDIGFQVEKFQRHGIAAKELPFTLHRYFGRVGDGLGIVTL